MAFDVSDESSLFDEAATELETEVREHLEEAKVALPEAEDLWDVEAENVLGVLNALRAACDVEAAENAIREARKQYLIGERADAFDDPDELKAEIGDVSDLVDDLSAAEGLTDELSSAIPGIRSRVQDLEGGEDGEGTLTEEGFDGDSDENTAVESESAATDGGEDSGDSGGQRELTPE